MLSLCLPGTSAFARDLYWTEQKQILASDIDGQNVTVIFDGDTSSPQMASYAVDIAVTDTHIYWSGHSGGDIWRANRDGTDATQLATEVGSSIHFLAISETTGKIYFSDYSNGIYSANLADGSAVTNFYSGNPGAFAGLVLDSTATSGVDELLWVSAGSTWLYRTVPEWWSTSADVELEGGNATYGVALDESTSTFYYTNFTDGTLRSYDLSTQEHELLWTPGMTSPLGVKLSPSGTHLLIAERGRGVSGYEIATGGYELLVASADAHFGVAVTADPGTLEVPPPPPPPAEDGDIIFQTQFEDDTVNELPKLEAEGGVWTNWQPRTTPDSVFVVKDEDDLFKYGAENKFLRVENSIGSYLDGHFTADAEVVTMSFDVIDRRTTVTSGGKERSGFSFFGEGERLHIFSIAGGGGIRGGGGGSIPQNQLARVDVVFNNSASEITYDSPEGVAHTLPSTHAAVWVNGELVNSHSPLGYRGAPGNIDFLRLPHFSSTDRFSIDLDNLTIFMGAHVFLPIVEGVEPNPNPDPTFLGHLNADFEGVPLGEITRENVGDFIHGNLSSIGFHTRYDTNTSDTDDPEFVPSPLLVAEDTEDRFGKGTANQVLRTNGARGWMLHAANNFNQEVMTLRIDMIAEPISNGRLTSRFFNADGELVSRIEIRTPEGAGSFDPNPGGFDYGTLLRIESVVNNSEQGLTYNTPGGGSRTLIAGGTDLWINGELVFSDSLELRTATSFGPIMSYSVGTFSTNHWDADIDLVQTLRGVQLVGAEQAGGFADWQGANFPGETDPAVIGPDADPDGDGISNLVEYALGLDPLAASVDGLPAGGTIESEGEEYLTLSFTRPAGLSDVAYNVAASSDMLDWSAGAVEVLVTPGAGETEEVIYRHPQPLSSGARGFLRLEVSSM